MVQGFSILFSILLCVTVQAKADQKEFTVFEARKTLPLSDTAPVFKDYYVNMGVENGVTVGSVLSVFRKIPVIDIYTNKAPGDLIVEVAKLKVIHTQRSMSVARVYAEANPKSIPVVQFEKVMLGDRVELAGKKSTDDSDDTDDTKDE